MDKLKEIFKLTGIPVFIASLCCLAPIVLVTFGLSTVAFATNLTNILDGRYQWVFNLAGLIALGVSQVMYFRKKGICTIDQAVKHRNEIINKTILVVISGLIIYFLFFYGFLNWIGRLLKIWS